MWLKLKNLRLAVWLGGPGTRSNLCLTVVLWGGHSPLGQHPSVFYRWCRGALWASLWLSHLKDWVQGWVRQSVFSLGNGLSSVEAWFSTALDIEEVLSGAVGDQLHGCGRYQVV